MLSLKTIAQQLSDEIKLDPLNLEKFDALYEHYFSTNNEYGMEVVRQGRYQALLKIYPQISKYISEKKYIQKEYYESNKRYQVEEYFFQIKQASRLNPSKFYAQILETSEKYLILQNNYLEDIYIASDVAANNNINHPDHYETFRLHFYVATKILVEMSKLLVELDIHIINRDYQQQFQKFFSILKEVKKDLPYSKLIQLFMPTDVTDKEVMDFLKANPVIRKLLRK